MGPRSFPSLFLIAAAASTARAQSPTSPDIGMREFASGQIKKGVRAIGFGGDGATWGNYSLVYRDQGTALLDYGYTGFTDGNAISFTAVGVTTPSLWRGLALYVIALSQGGSGLNVPVRSPGFGGDSVSIHGDATDQALFAKLAMPLGHGFSAGVLLSYELSQFEGIPADGSPGFVEDRTQWLPSGGFGVSWQPDPRVLVGMRVILNHDWQIRTDPSGTYQGLARLYEGRLGASVSPWGGCLLDAGFTVVDRANEIAGTHATIINPNFGVEQALFDRHLVLRAGADEFSPDAGISVKFSPLNLDVAYVYNLGWARIGTLFGAHSSSVLATLTFDYAAFIGQQQKQPGGS